MRSRPCRACESPPPPPPSAVPDNLVAAELQVLHPEPEAFDESQPSFVQEHRHDPMRAAERTAHRRRRLRTREHDRQPLRSLRTHDVLQPPRLTAQDVLVQEQHRRQCLVLSRSAHMTLDGERAEKLPDLGLAHLRRVPIAVVQNEASDPAHTRLLGPVAVMQRTNRVADLVEGLALASTACVQRRSAWRRCRLGERAGNVLQPRRRSLFCGRALCRIKKCNRRAVQLFAPAPDLYRWPPALVLA